MCSIHCEPHISKFWPQPPSPVSSYLVSSIKAQRSKLKILDSEYSVLFHNKSCFQAHQDSKLMLSLLPSLGLYKNHYVNMNNQTKKLINIIKHTSWTECWNKACAQSSTFLWSGQQPIQLAVEHIRNLWLAPKTNIIWTSKMWGNSIWPIFAKKYQIFVSFLI